MSGAALPAAGSFGAWRLAIRLPTLPAAIAPVLVGCGAAIGAGVFSWGPAFAALVGALLLQVGANLANDLFDFRKGSDTAERLGPLRATQSGLLTERQVLAGAIVVFALATLSGLYLAWVAGWPVVAAGLASIAAALAYTGGPWPFGYHALGDVFTFVFFGLVATAGTYFVQAGELSILALMASVPMGCSVTAILVVNNLRDINTDAATGKNTLAVVLGDGPTRIWFGVLVAGALAGAVLTWPVGGGPAVVATLAAVAALISPARAVFGGVTGPALNVTLRQTARFHLAVGLLLAIGLATG
ncbi:MAG: 1,4-dihydroxy-2-naphthoate polyprenyltransferase [Dehalococcoidia bacterium]